ncbi:defense against restriction DarA-related protein [Methylovulum psychrotolerans]|uniref:Defence against restriction A N-terminal domain-containing protein n=1 Tax=Methylovulum psychrotolerans TaxID=1704499 RepID=A0A1Z4BV93_9GAMM|nr:hypothetical protein [Methylovulum psychrotolerans]ASF45215.1 hypothetical protein CEK71_03585 [Methylovulum psychrotolerans]
MPTPSSNQFLFSFDDLSNKKDGVAKELKQAFEKHHVTVAQVDIATQVRRTSNVSYREISITFADSQVVVLRVNQTGDIFQVLVNRKLFPIKSHDNHAKAVIEIVNALDAGRSAFQKKLAATAIKVPKGIVTPAPKMVQVLTAKRDALKEAIAAVNEEISAILGGDNANA